MSLATQSIPSGTNAHIRRQVRDTSRLRRRRPATAAAFSAFGELETFERHQLKMMSGYAGVALLCMFVLQLVLG